MERRSTKIRRHAVTQIENGAGIILQDLEHTPAPIAPSHTVKWFRRVARSICALVFRNARRGTSKIRFDLNLALAPIWGSKKEFVVFVSRIESRPVHEVESSGNVTTEVKWFSNATESNVNDVWQPDLSRTSEVKAARTRGPESLQGYLVRIPRFDYPFYDVAITLDFETRRLRGATDEIEQRIRALEARKTVVTVYYDVVGSMQLGPEGDIFVVSSIKRATSSK